MILRRLLYLPLVVLISLQCTYAQVFPEYGIMLRKNRDPKTFKFSKINTAFPSGGKTAASVQSPGDIAFIRDGDVYTVTVDGSQFRRLTSDGRNAFPVWSPNGRYIAFSKASVNTPTPSASLWVITSDGKFNKQVGKTRDYRAVYPASWLPDSKGLIVSIHTLESDAGPELAVVTLDGSSYAPYQKWRAAGAQAGFLKDRDGGKKPEFTPGQAAAFSPDGKKLTFTAGTVHFIDAPRLDLFEMKIDGSNLKRLNSLPYIWIECLRRNPKAANFLSAEEHYSSTGKYEAGIWLLGPNGKPARKLTSSSTASFSAMDWSPSGSYIVFQVTGSGYPRFESPSDFPTLSKHSSVWSMKPDGSGRYKLADNACHPNWR